MRSVRFIAATVALLASFGCDGPGAAAVSPPGERSGVSPPPIRQTAADSASSAVAATSSAVSLGRAPGRFTAAPWLSEAERVVGVSTGKGVRVVAIGPGWLKVFSPTGELLARRDGVGAGHALSMIELGWPRSTHIVVGRGRSRAAPNAASSVLLYPLNDLAAVPEVVPLPATTRAQIVGVQPDPGRAGRLWVGTFDSKYMVVVLEATRGPDGWQTRRLARVRVALGMTAVDHDGDGVFSLVLARPYGDAKLADGDVFLLGADGVRQPVPSVRGARAVLAVGQELWFADGWHRAYGKKARALVTRADWGQVGWSTQIVAESPGRYGYTQLVAGDFDGDADLEIVAVGDGPALLVDGVGPGLLFGPAEIRGAAAVDLDADGRDEVILLGPTPGVWRAGQ